MSETAVTYHATPRCADGHTDVRPVASRVGGYRGRRRSLAAETSPSSAAAPAWDRDLHGVIDRLVDLDLDALSPPQLRALLDTIRRPLARLEAVRACWAAALERATISHAPEQGRGAAQQTARRDLSRDQRMTPSQVKGTVHAGQAAAAHPATRQAFTDGELSPDHVRIIAQCLSALPPDRREEFETDLLALADGQDALTFGRAARRRLAETSPTDAARTEQQRRTGRRVNATDTPDGGFAFSGLLYGTAAEEARVAFQAFRRPDTPGEHRTPPQRAADAFEALIGAALRSGDAPTQHGTRPHVTVLITAQDLAEHQAGAAPTTGRYALSGETATTAELAPLLTDATLVRAVLDATNTPTEVSRQVRTVPHGLYRALLIRDAGCRWPGCDAPPAWCDVAHANTRYTNGGRLALDNAVLLCRRHHRLFDHHRWTIRTDGTTIHYHHPTKPPMTSYRDPTSPGPPPGGADPPPGGANHHGPAEVQRSSRPGPALQLFRDPSSHHDTS